MRRFTHLVPEDLLQKVRDAGFYPMMASPTYADVLDWLADMDIYPQINSYPVDSALNGRYTEYEAIVVDARGMYDGYKIRHDVKEHEYSPGYTDWCKCCKDAIEKAIEIIET